MLETLTSINWDNLGTPHIPGLLQELASDDRRIQEKAWSGIGETLIPWTALEGSRLVSELLSLPSRAALYVTIPLLVELLSYEAITSKDLILDLLNDIARYVEADMFVPQEPKSEKELYRSNARQAFDAVADGKPTYDGLTNSPLPDVAANAKHILRELDRLSNLIEGWNTI